MLRRTEFPLLVRWQLLHHRRITSISVRVVFSLLLTCQYWRTSTKASVSHSDGEGACRPCPWTKQRTSELLLLLLELARLLLKLEHPSFRLGCFLQHLAMNALICSGSSARLRLPPRGDAESPWRAERANLSRENRLRKSHFAHHPTPNPHLCRCMKNAHHPRRSAQHPAVPLRGLHRLRLRTARSNSERCMQRHADAQQPRELYLAVQVPLVTPGRSTLAMSVGLQRSRGWERGACS